MSTDRRKAAQKAWRDANPGYRKAYYEANRERALAYQKAYYETNPGQKKAWRAARPDQKKAWREANREHALAYDKAYREANPSRRHIQRANRRALNEGAFVESVDPDAVFVRDGGVCQICDAFIGDAKWHIDHRIPLVRGGKHSYANTQLAHAYCNLVKHSKVLS